MEMQCFILHNQTVSGPFNKEVLSEKLATGEYPSNSQIWWKGQKEWVNLATFHEYKPADAKVLHMNKHLNWYIEKDSKVSGPYQKEELLAFLMQATTLANVRVWKKGEKHKATVYQYNDLTNALGIVQRKSLRAPIVGDVKLDSLNGSISEGKICSISEGGVGLTHLNDLSVGDKVHLSIESPLLSIPIHTSAVIKYIAPNGRIGAQFESLNSESITSIIEYINQFKTPEKKKAA